MQNHVMNTYGRMPVNFVSGAGSYLTDSEGKTYFDGLTGIAVCGLGHAHPHVAQALAEQAQTLLHTSNLYEIPLQTKLANRLCERSGMDNVFFCNSGAEANEAAIKLARLKGNKEGIKSPCYCSCRRQFPWPHHGHPHRHRQPQSTCGV
jgi:acetylornithine aminotransferase